MVKVITKSLLKRLEEIKDEDNYKDVNALIEDLLIFRDKIKLKMASKLFREKLKDGKLDILDDEDLKVISLNK